MKKKPAAVVFNNPPRFRITREKIVFDGKRFQAEGIRSVSQDTVQIEMGRFYALIAIIILSMFLAVYTAQMLVVPFLMLLLLGTTLWLRQNRSRYTIDIEIHDGRVLSYQCTDADLHQNLCSALRLVHSFHAAASPVPAENSVSSQV